MVWCEAFRAGFEDVSRNFVGAYIGEVGVHYQGSKAKELLQKLLIYFWLAGRETSSLPVWVEHDRPAYGRHTLRAIYPFFGRHLKRADSFYTEQA